MTRDDPITSRAPVRADLFVCNGRDWAPVGVHLCRDGGDAAGLVRRAAVLWDSPRTVRREVGTGADLSWLGAGGCTVVARMRADRSDVCAAAALLVYVCVDHYGGDAYSLVMVCSPPGTGEVTLGLPSWRDGRWTGDGGAVVWNCADGSAMVYRPGADSPEYVRDVKAWGSAADHG